MLIMMKFFVTSFVLLTLSLGENLALDAENYSAYIEELSHDENFLEEYTKWSSELFSQRDYIYGNPHSQFLCPIDNSTDNNNIPTSVHTLRPSDIKCIAAIGDSFTTGLGARAITPMDLLFEARGISWSVGGDYHYSKILTLPNILRQYNAKLKGFSTKGYVMSDNTYAKNNRLNVAKSGDHSNDIVQQAEFLIERLTNEKYCDWNNDWKLITIFIGRNDLCSFCEDSNVTKYTPEQYITSVRDTLDRLYNAPIPRTLINLVLAPDIRTIKDLNNSSYICQTLLKKLCPCAAFPTSEQAKILNDYIPRYQHGLKNLTDSGRYEGRNDFTVVIQPFMAKTKLSYKDDNHTIDFSYFAPDCFHFSGKGHSQAALSLWNNMFERVGHKRWFWRLGEPLKCPTKEYPYIFTSKNSVKSSDEVKQTTNVPTITNNSNSTSEVNITINQTSTVINNSTSTYGVSIIVNQTSTVINNSSEVNSTQSYRKHRKDKKSDSDSSFNKMKFFVITGFLFIIIMILIFGITRRRKQHTFVAQIEPENCDYTNEDFDDDEVIYSQSKTKSGYSNNNQIPKTHGTRMNFD